MSYAQQFLTDFLPKYSSEPEFSQTVEEVVTSLESFLEHNPVYRKEKILERITQPERAISFRVIWEDDQGGIQVNRGYRVQFNSAIGPYKGGLRFHPSVNLSILKFLGFEQTLKNSLTGLPMGGGKGGSDFDPHGKSDREIMSFCMAFMSELFRHIGAQTDVPAGDIGVGGREIGYLFGMYKKLANEFTGTLTGKGLNWGGSLIRTEATGYGVVYFAQEMLAHTKNTLQGKTVVISGSGNVAQYAAQKAIAAGAKVLTLSDSNGYLLFDHGLTQQQLETIKHLKNVTRGRLKDFKSAKYIDGLKPWTVKADIYLPCATQNEVTLADAKLLIANKALAVVEGSNMSTENRAVELFLNSQVLYSPGKASNAGGVAVSGLEMTQNRLGLSWTADEVDTKLQEIMRTIHTKCVEHGTTGTKINYVQGANIAGFQKVADSMISQGLV